MNSTVCPKKPYDKSLMPILRQPAERFNCCVQLLKQRMPLHRRQVELSDRDEPKTGLSNKDAKPCPETMRDLLKGSHLLAELSDCLVEARHFTPPHSKKNLVAPFNVRQGTMPRSPGLKDVASTF